MNVLIQGFEDKETLGKWGSGSYDHHSRGSQNKRYEELQIGPYHSCDKPLSFLPTSDL